MASALFWVIALVLLLLSGLRFLGAYLTRYRIYVCGYNFIVACVWLLGAAAFALGGYIVR